LTNLTIFEKLKIFKLSRINKKKIHKFLKFIKIKFLKMFKNLLLEEAEDNWSSGGHDEGDIQVSISDFDSPKVNIQ